MQYINRPPPKEEDQPAPISFKGGNVPNEIFKHEFVPFAFTSILMVAIVTFDLITDWLAWNLFRSFHFSELVESKMTRGHKEALISLEDIYCHLPLIYFILCISFSATSLLELLRVIRNFLLQHQKHKENLDGVPFKKNVLDRLSGEVTLLLLVLLGDLPLSLVHLAIQAAVSCPHVIPFRSAIFLLTSISTCLSLCWKIAQLIWRCGCMRHHSDTSRGCPAMTLRFLSLFLILSGLAITTLNLILLTDFERHSKPSPLTSHLTERIRISRWLREDHLSLVVRQSNLDSTSSLPNTLNMHQNEASYLEAANLLSLDYIIHSLHETNNHSFTRSCSSIGNMTRPFINPSHLPSLDDASFQCDIVYQLYFSMVDQVIFYNLVYRLRSMENPDVCLTDHFQTPITSDEYFYHMEPETNSSNSVLIRRPSTNEYVTESLSSQIFLELDLSPTQRTTWLKCAFDVIEQETMFHADPCNIPEAASS